MAKIKAVKVSLDTYSKLKEIRDKEMLRDFDAVIRKQLGWELAGETQ